MAKSILSKSNQNLDIDEIAETYNYRIESLALYFSDNNLEFESIFLGYTEEEVQQEFDTQVLEAERDACLNLLAAIEAMFRLDYAIRCEEKDKAEISRKFRSLFTDFQYRISLEEGIFEEWRESNMIKGSIISELKGAFKYRHWLAHGRYWTLKAGREHYDFYYLYNLAEKVNSFPFKTS